MPRLSEMLKKLNRDPSIKDYSGSVVQPNPNVAIGQPQQPNPQASPTFSKNFANMLGQTNQPEMYNQTTLQAPSPTNNNAYLEGPDAVREHLANFGKNQEKNRQKYRGY